MKALLVERNVARFALARVVSGISGSGRAAAVGPLRLSDVDAPDLPGPGWRRVDVLLAGICGSDLATLDGRSSRYFEDLVSFPFVPGHEIVGTVRDDDPHADGADPGNEPSRRVVIEPAIGCVARGIEPPCDPCAHGNTGGCERVAFGNLSAGLQIGYCSDTGGGWSASGLVAHESQLHAVPDSFSDQDAVIVEPTACGVHAALAAQIRPGDPSVAVVLGSGTIGLATVAALHHLARPATLIASGRYPHQRTLAAELGADLAVASDELSRAVRRTTRSLATTTTLAAGHTGSLTGGLTSGADAVIDCIGSADSLAHALAIVKPTGTVVLAGMPGHVSIDMAGLWHRQIKLVGAYAYGVEHLHDGRVARTFDLAVDLVRRAGLGRLVTATYPLERYEEAIAHAGNAGRRGAVKIAFDLRAPTRGAWRRQSEPANTEGGTNR